MFLSAQGEGGGGQGVSKPYRKGEKATLERDEGRKSPCPLPRATVKIPGWFVSSRLTSRGISVIRVTLLEGVDALLPEEELGKVERIRIGTGRSGYIGSKRPVVPTCARNGVSVPLS